MTSVRRASAVDINPVQNPDVRGSTVLSAAGLPAFDGIGWGRGGSSTTCTDDQHVCATGR